MEARKLPRSHNPRVPDAGRPYHHYLPLQTRFTDYDMLGHMNNNVYMSFMDMAKIYYFEDVMGGDIDWRKPGVVVVNANIDYFAPVMPGESIEVYTRVCHIGEKSITLEQRIVESATLETKCLARTVMAGFDPATNQSVAIDDHWRSSIENYEGRKL